MNRLIILIALIFTTTAQADSNWVYSEKDLGLELNKGNLKTVIRMGKLEKRKCLRFLQYSDPHTMTAKEIADHRREWKEKCYAGLIIGNQISKWYQAEQTKYKSIWKGLSKDYMFRHDAREFTDLTIAITNELQLDKILFSSF